MSLQASRDNLVLATGLNRAPIFESKTPSSNLSLRLIYLFIIYLLINWYIYFIIHNYKTKIYMNNHLKRTFSIIITLIIFFVLIVSYWFILTVTDNNDFKIQFFWVDFTNEFSLSLILRKGKSWLKLKILITFVENLLFSKIPFDWDHC